MGPFRRGEDITIYPCMHFAKREWEEDFFALTSYLNTASAEHKLRDNSGEKEDFIGSAKIVGQKREKQALNC